MFAVISILFGCLGICYLAHLDIQHNKSRPAAKRTSPSIERERFFKNMEWLGYNYYETLDDFKKLKSYDELIRINNELEKTIVKIDKAYEPIFNSIFNDE